MYKIGIITLNGYFNYGNRLQNYALQEVIKSLGYECETIWNSTRINKNIQLENNTEKNKSIVNRFIEGDLKEKLKIISNKVNYEIYKVNKVKIMSLKLKRESIFKNFSDEYIKESKFKIDINNIQDTLCEQYDYFISGSDQVWNPNDPTVSEVNFITFAPRNKRLTYAPSFGVSVIPQQYKEDYTKWLNEIDNISVRECEGAKIIKDLTGKEATVVVDPTMLLTKEKWLSISKACFNKPNKKYILTYFLGGIPKEVNIKIKKIARKYKLEVINLADIKKKKYYLSGPSEFIDYINDASIFFTDSFHGCVFSVLLETPFIVCERISANKEVHMGSRINTFIKKFNLEHRRFKNIDDENIFVADYKEANKILELERKKSFSYLAKLFNNKN